MIISDEDDQQIKDPPVTVPTIRCPEPAASRPLSGPLPDYETSQALAFRDFNESQITLYKPPPRRRFLDSRFWRAALISLVVYIFLSLVIGVPIIVHKENENQQKYPYNSFSLAMPPWQNKSSGFNPPGGINASSLPQSAIVPVCNNWTEVEYLDNAIVLAMTENYISPNGLFSFTSNASSSNDANHVQGAFFTGINPDDTVQEAVLSITLQSSSPGVFSRTSVCSAVADNFTDVSLYSPSNLTSTDSIQYNITLLFPQNQVPSQIDSFCTSLPLFDQRFGSFDDNVEFREVTIEGAVSRVTVDSIRAKRILVDTSLESVTGTFHASASLLISTVLAPIVVNISLYNDPGSPFPTILDVHTGHSNLTANVIVLAPNGNPPLRPNFIANFRTFAGSLFTSFLHDPSSSPTAIELSIFNDLAPVDVILDSFFEGLFQVSTKQAFVSVSQGSATMSDPWAPDLERTLITYSNSSTRSYGWIGWGGVPPISWNGYQQGEVLIDSSLANVTLSFLG